MKNLLEKPVLAERRALPEGWEWKRLIDVLLSLENGARPKGGVDNIEDGVPSIGGEHLNKDGGFIFENIKFIPAEFYESMKRGRIENGDVLVVKDGATTGKVSLVRNDFPYQESAVNEHVFICRPNLKYVLPEYLFYNLFSPLGKNKILRSFHGAAQGGINTQFANDYKIPLPPLPTQRRIVSILEKAEETKRLRAQADELTDKLLQSVFLEMFGDPVRNPKRWEMKKLSAISYINMGQSPPGESYSKNGMGIPLLNGPTEFGDTHPTTAQWTDKPTKMCNNGDILFCVRGATAGRMNWADQRYCIGRGIAAINSIPNISDNRYLYQILLMNYERFQATGKGSTFINISSSELGNLIAPLPPLPLQQKFARIVEKIESMRQSQNQSKQQIEDLFSALMQKAFRGELEA